jgi:hypothetical protein
MDTDEPATAPPLRITLLPAPPAVLAPVVAQLLVDYFAVPTFHGMDLSDSAEGFIVCTIFGMMMAQLALLVGYQAWGRDNWLRRWAKSTFLAVLCWAAYAAGAISTGDSFEVGSIAQLLGVVMAGLFLFLTIPMWGTRWLLGLRFDRATPNDSAEPARSQFRLRDLFTVTLAAAVILGILKSAVGRDLVDQDWLLSWNELGGLAIFKLFMTALCAVAAIPTAWVSLGKHRLGLACAGLAVYLAVAVTAERFAYYMFLDGGPNAWLIVAGLNTGVVAQVLLTGLLLRACGYRLRLHGARKKEV